MNNSSETILSIIVPVYNGEKSIEKCIRSIQNQVIKNIEIIIVNDGSTDGTYKILESLKEKDKRIRIIDKKNGGVSSARNEGIKASNSKYIGFVDSDDFINENMYEHLIDIANKNNSEVVLCRYKEIYNDYEKNEKILPIYSESKRLKEEILLKILGNASEKDLSEKNAIMGSVWRMIFRKDLIYKNNILFNECIDYGEDKLFCIQTLSKSEQINITNDILYNVKINKNSLSRRYIYKFDEKVDNLMFECKKIIKETKFKYYDDEYIEKIFTLMDFENYIYKISNFCKKDNKIGFIHKLFYPYKLRTNLNQNNMLSRINPKDLDKRWKIIYFCLKYNLKIIVVLYFLLIKNKK